MKKTDTKSLVIYGLLTAIVIIFSATPYGTIALNPTLSITLNVVPVALAAVTLGPRGGAIIGGVFGICSFLQGLGLLIPSKMGMILTDINPFLSFVQRFVPRVLEGFLAGLVFILVAKLINVHVACFVTGFCTALFNTILFMSALVLLFGNTDYMKDTMAGKSFLAYMVASISGNAVFEMIAATLLTGAIGFALYKSKLIKLPESKKEKAA